MNKEFKYTSLPDKYTVEEFIPIFYERQGKLFEDYKTLTSDEAKKRFSELFEDIPLGLHINTYAISKALTEHFPDWYKSDISEEELKKMDEEFILKHHKKWNK